MFISKKIYIFFKNLDFLEKIYYTMEILWNLKDKNEFYRIRKYRQNQLGL